MLQIILAKCRNLMSIVGCELSTRIYLDLEETQGFISKYRSIFSKKKEGLQT